jgi:two-component system chemotaxis response regulator CheY
MAPIILVTGYSARPRVEEARDAGVTEFLVKPFTATDLTRRLQHVINNPRNFIDYNGYFGPDRRRKADELYNGPRRREDDIGETWNVS